MTPIHQSDTATWWQRLVCDLRGHRWRQDGIGRKTCTRCGLRSGGYGVGIP